eukprot:TRINITY_DN47115_c0_g1_i1.p1 TRINITY_DN47115_c0_g1~~TRINITY_DN47115_c0_g1_i1.p1  ORF type:complete len:279 (+),score=82.15 TRINITY_DN47115_c0_g1_i1:34-870(+)
MSRKGPLRKGQDLTSQYLELQVDPKRRGKGNERRPMLARDCNDLGDAERYRVQIIMEVTKKIDEIQNAALGEFRIQELNDEINKLIREKTHWQRRIIDLGGPDHFLAGTGHAEGLRAQGSGGYMYFGAAKNLPGVKELFEVEAQGPAKRSRAELYKSITPDYYGYRDDNDGLLNAEKRAETKMRARAAKDLKAKMTEAGVTSYQYVLETTDDIMNVPSQSEVERRMLESRKKQLLARYGIVDIPVVDKEADKLKSEESPVMYGPTCDSPSPPPSPTPQ